MVAVCVDLLDEVSKTDNLNAGKYDQGASTLYFLHPISLEAHIIFSTRI